MRTTTVPRRTVAAGAAWAVPVIAVGAMVPMSAASPVINIVQATGLGCKEPGKSFSKDFPYAYRLYLDVTVLSEETLCLLSATSPGGTVTALDNQCFTVFPVGNPTQIEVRIASTNSANGTAVLVFEHGQGETVTVSVQFGDGFHPCTR